MKKKVYIEKAVFNPLGYVVETEEQRQLTKQIKEGAVVSTDSPFSQWNLHTMLNIYLFDHTEPLDTLEMPEHHTSSITYRTKSGGIIKLDNSMGWSTISCDEKGKTYIENLLREKGYSVITTKEAITG